MGMSEGNKRLTIILIMIPTDRFHFLSPTNIQNKPFLFICQRDRLNESETN